MKDHNELACPHCGGMLGPDSLGVCDYKCVSCGREYVMNGTSGVIPLQQHADALFAEALLRRKADPPETDEEKPRRRRRITVVPDS